MNEFRAFSGESNKGWSFEVFLHEGKPTGEIRFAFHGAPTFIVPMTLTEIVIFASKREDLMAAYVEQLIREHRPH